MSTKSKNVKSTQTGPKKVYPKFKIDYSVPANDRIFDGAAFEKFLHDSVKVEGKKGQLGNKVEINRTEGHIQVQTSIQFSKRYLKYLTKKFLQKNKMRNFLRVIATDPLTYSIIYFNVDNNDDDDNDD